MQKDENLIVGSKFYDKMRNSENRSSNLPRSRVSSLSSFFSSSSVDQKPQSVFGFRRFAKTYFLGSGRRTSSKLVGNQSSNLSTRQSVNRVSYLDRQLPLRTQEMIYDAKGQQQANGNEREATIGMQKGTEGVLNYRFDLYDVPRMVSDLSNEESNPESAAVINFNCILDVGYPYEDKNSSRSVILAEIPVNTGLGSILSQICGGPLEAVLTDRSGSDNGLTHVRLDFLTTEGARSFMKYGSSNLFKINGVHLVPEWAKHTETMSPALSAEFFEEIPEVCRCLIMKKYMNGVKRYKHNDPSKDSVPDILDVAEIRRDFAVFGKIQDIAPIVSRKLCISISFYSVHSAIRAMDEYEDPTSTLNKKYFKNWAIWYGRDITDRPCIEL